VKGETRLVGHNQKKFSDDCVIFLIQVIEIALVEPKWVLRYHANY
jgi:hypothetical protein